MNKFEELNDQKLDQAEDVTMLTEDKEVEAVNDSKKGKKSTVKTVFEAIYSSIKAFVFAVGKAISATFSFFKAKLADAASWTSSFAQARWVSVKSISATVYAYAKDFFVAVGNAVSAVFSFFKAKIVGAASWTADFAKARWATVVAVSTSAKEYFLSNPKATVSTASDSVVNSNELTVAPANDDANIEASETNKLEAKVEAVAEVAAEEETEVEAVVEDAQVSHSL